MTIDLRSPSLAALTLAGALHAQGDWVQRARHLSPDDPLFGGRIELGDQLGSAVAYLGRVTSPPEVELHRIALGARTTGGPFVFQGDVWIVDLDTTGAPVAARSLRASGLSLPLPDLSAFGSALANVGDLDGNGYDDLAVGATHPADVGAVRIVTLGPAGEVLDEFEIPGTPEALGGPIAVGAQFGASLACLGDLDGDGATELVVGAPYDSTLASQAGALWILDVASDLRLVSAARVALDDPAFAGVSPAGRSLGTAVADLGDLDGDGLRDLAVSTINPAFAGLQSQPARVWRLELDASAAIVSATPLLDAARDVGPQGQQEALGLSLAAPGDLDGNGVPDLLVGYSTQLGPFDFGAGGVRVLTLTGEGLVLGSQSIENGEEGLALPGPPSNDDFGASLAVLEDLDGDGRVELLVGSPSEGKERGAWILTPHGPVVEALLGSGVNPEDLYPGDTPPVSGATWRPVVVPSGASVVTSTVLALSRAGTSGIPLAGMLTGELLVDLAPERLSSLRFAAPGEPFAVRIGLDPDLVGLECFAQAATLDAGGTWTLTNGLALTVGLPGQ